jgi:ATP-independent RNA helicase DbpA
MTMDRSYADILGKLGFEKETDVQEAAIPVLAGGKSLFALAPTGSGKTLAFLIPLMQKIDCALTATQILVLTPTRELGVQISQVAERLARLLNESSTRGVTVRNAFGGQKIEGQIVEIQRRPHLVVATPGRALDLLNREVLSLQELKAFVLDEADLMLGMGFEEQVKKICDSLPNRVQTALFSATEAELQTTLHNRLAHRAVRIDVRGGEKRESGAAVEDGASPETRQDLHQILVVPSHQEKQNSLNDFLRENESRIASGVVFCQTRAGASTVCENLRSAGFLAEELSGGLGQIERATILRRFKARGVKYLVATNIAARGIDILDLSIVVNFDLPSTPDEYVHRSGRSGRAGKSGWTVSLSPRSSLEFLTDILQKKSLQAELIEVGAPSGEVNGVAGQRQNTPKPPESGFSRIHINRGKSSKIRPGDILGTLVKICGLQADEVGNIYIFDHFSHVEVSSLKSREVISKLCETPIKGMSVKAQDARELSNVRRESPQQKKSR